VAQRALRDQSWQALERQRLTRESIRLAELLARYGLPPSGGTALFQWVECERAPALYESFAQQGILVRRFDDPAGLRFGLPGAEAQWQRLEQSLQGLL
jgi:cobalamin biosynthetic protein CobC